MEKKINLSEEMNKFEHVFSCGDPQLIPLYLYHAISPPLDYYHGYRPLFMIGHDLYKNEMNQNPTEVIEASKGMSIFTRLLYNVIECFHKEFSWPRGEPIYYRFQDSEACIGQVPVLVFKEDSNGTMHAFSYDKDSLLKLPHDFGCEWELQDREEIKKS